MSSWPTTRISSVAIGDTEYDLTDWYSRKQFGKAIKSRIKYAAVEIEYDYGQLKRYNVLLDGEAVGYVESFGSNISHAWNGRRLGSPAGWESHATKSHEITVRPYGKTETHTSTAITKSNIARTTRKEAAIELIADEIKVGNITL